MHDAQAAGLRERLPGALPEVALAPGRINLIGEHVDYNDGWVLPAAIDLHVAVALAPRDDDVLHVHAATLGRTQMLRLSALEPRHGGHVAGVAWALRAAGIDVRGADLLIDADLPRGAGLSSSAAVELAVARALVHAAGARWDALPMAQACLRAENEYVGVPCGPMDQIASACGREGHALLLDCRTLTFEEIALPPDAAFLVMDSGVRRALADGSYAERRTSCERALAALRRHDPGLRALRDAQASQLVQLRGALDETTWRRASHVLAELPRPRQFVEALAQGDLPRAGALLDASHRSLAELFEVSCPELDALCALARGLSGCHGARLTGAGFGGCAIALVERAHAQAFLAAMPALYRTATGRDGRFFEARAAQGAHLVSSAGTSPRAARGASPRPRPPS